MNTLYFMKKITLFFIALFTFGIAFSQDQKQSEIPQIPNLNADNQIERNDFTQINSQRVESNLGVLESGCNIGNETGPNWASTSFSPNYLLGVSFTLLEPGVLNSINLVGNGTGANVQMAVYNDNAGVPNSLIISSGVTTVAGGIVTLPVTATPLVPGDYWIMAVYETMGSHSNYDPDANNDKDVYYDSLPFGDTIPANASGFTTYVGGDLLYFLDITCETSAPENDLCVDAIAIACGDVVVGDTINATDSGSNEAPDVWYSFTGTGDTETVTLSLCDGGTDFDSTLRVFDACDGSQLFENDDSCGLQSELSFDSNGTSTYYIMIEGYGINSGNFSLDVSCVLLDVSDSTIEGFSYYPNPTSNVVHLSSLNNIERVSIYTILGQKVIDQSVNATTSEINIANLVTGSYLMQVSANGKTATYKIFKN